MTIRNDAVFEAVEQHKNNGHTIEPAFYYPRGFRNGSDGMFTINCINCDETLHTVKPEPDTPGNSDDETVVHSDRVFDQIEHHATSNHKIQLAYYGASDGPIQNIALECRDCHVVLHDIE